MTILPDTYAKAEDKWDKTALYAVKGALTKVGSKKPTFQVLIAAFIHLSSAATPDF